MKFTAFYSWQTDSPNSTNRGFIESCLVKTSKEISTDINIELDIRIDHSTVGVTGSPDIAKTIFEKIESADCFVADISLVVGKKGESRLSPNPNVLIELGFAIKALGWERIILVSNSLGYEDKDYPFDLRAHRRVSYELEEGADKAAQKTLLSRGLKGAFEGIISNRISKLTRPTGPELAASWALCKIDEEGDFSDPTPVPYITLQRFQKIDFISVTKLDEELARVEAKDGSFDDKWSEKLDSYRRAIRTYQEFLQNPSHIAKWHLFANHHRSVTIALSLKNIGSSPADSAKVRIKLPEWVIATDSIPKDDFPGIPSEPTPRRKTLMDTVLNLGLGGAPERTLLSNYPVFDRLNIRGEMMDTPYINPHQSYNLKRKDGASIVEFEVARLFHKHAEESEERSIFLWASADAPKGKHLIKAQLFCEQYEDFVEQDLEIIVS